MSSCLLVIDVQKDFCKGGALEVPSADAVVPTINTLLHSFGTSIASQDWHPPNHCSFVENGGDWPNHCVAGTNGAEFHERLESHRFKAIVRKGTFRDNEAYSAFCDTGLHGLLKDLGITEVMVCGIATDYCVLATAMDAVKKFEVCVIADACQGVSSKTTAEAFKKMKKAGIEII